MAVSRLDPDELRAFAGRDWQLLERLDLRARAQQPVEESIRLAIALYEAARATVPGWPDDETRREDLRHHEHMCRMLRRAQHVGRR